VHRRRSKRKGPAQRAGPLFSTSPKDLDEVAAGADVEHRIHNAGDLDRRVDGAGQVRIIIEEIRVGTNRDCGHGGGVRAGARIDQLLSIGLRSSGIGEGHARAGVQHGGHGEAESDRVRTIGEVADRIDQAMAGGRSGIGNVRVRSVTCAEDEHVVARATPHAVVASAADDRVSTVVTEVLAADPGTNLLEIEQAFRDGAAAAYLVATCDGFEVVLRVMAMLAAVGKAGVTSAENRAVLASKR